MKQEHSEERKFNKAVKEKQDADMKQFVSQQKADYRGTKAMYKKVGAIGDATANFSIMFVGEKRKLVVEMQGLQLLGNLQSAL